MTLDAKRDMIEWVKQIHHLSSRRACQLAQLSRSTLYRQSKRATLDRPVIDALNEVVGMHQRWGFWKCFHRLRHQGHAWNHKRVYRVYCQLKLNLVQRTKKRLPKRVIQPLNEAQQPNQIWAIDFMHDRVASRSFRTFNVMDEANRKALGIDIGTSMPSERVVRYLNQLLEIHGKPQAIRCDNGPEFISQTMMYWAKEHCIELKFIQPGKPNQNALIERFNRSFRTEVLSCYLFDSLKEVEELTQEWLYQYNHVRPHDALNGLTPVAFSERF